MSKADDKKPPQLTLVKDGDAMNQLGELLATQLEDPRAPRPSLNLGPGIYFDVAHDDYHDDPCTGPSLSSSIASIIVDESPLHAWFGHRRLGNGRQPDATKRMTRGTVMHKLMLGRGQDVEIVDAKDFKTNAAKDARDAALAAGKVPVIAAHFEEYSATAKVLIEKLARRGIRFGGQTEVTAIWERGGALCRGRFDHFDPGALVVDDLKICDSASPKLFKSKCISLGYDIQERAYVEAVETLIPNAAGRARFRFIACEAEPPYDIVVFEATGTMRELGARKWRRAVETWARCLAKYGKDEWPGYSAEVVKVEAPPWALNEETDRQTEKLENDNASAPF